MHDLFLVGGINGEITAHNPNNGEVVWKLATSFVPYTFVPHGTNIYVIGTNGYLLQLDKTTGSIIWSDTLRARISSPPLLIGDKLYISTGLRNIYSYALN